MANEGKGRRSIADYEELLAKREASGLTLRAFAESVGIKPATIYWWNRRLRAKQDRADSRPRLVPLQVADAVSTTDRFELKLGNECVLSIPTGFDAGELRRLLAALQA